MVEKLSVNEAGYNRLPVHADGTPFLASQQRNLQRSRADKVKLSFVESIIELHPRRWLIIRSRRELAADKNLKKYKHESGDFVFSRSSTWRSRALKELVHPTNTERNRIHEELASEQLFECLFPTILHFVVQL